MDDKKKIIALAVLLVIIAAVGAFQFVGGGKPEPKKTDSKAAVKKDLNDKKGTSEMANAAGAYMEGADVSPDLVSATAMTERDPFDSTTWTVIKADPKVEPVVGPKPQVNTKGQNGKQIPPFDPSGTLPPVDGVGKGGAVVEPGQSLKVQGEFAYTASGVIIGSKPAVVLTSDSGKQMLVTLGSSIDGDSKVVGISKNKITIRHKNKTFTVSVGGNSSGK